MEQYFRVGVITSAHGVRGAVKVYPSTEDPSRFAEIDTVYFSRHESEKLEGTLHITRTQFQQNMVLLTLKEITDRNMAEQYKGCQLWVDRDHALQLEQDEYYLADLIGCRIIDEDGLCRGAVREYMETGSNLVLIVENETKEWMLPFIKDCILHVDVEQQIISIHMMKGLEEL